MRGYLLALEGSGKLVQVSIRPEPSDPFLALVAQVTTDCVKLHTFNRDTFEQWGEVVVMIQDVYRIDLWSSDVSRELLEHCAEMVGTERGEE